MRAKSIPWLRLRDGLILPRNILILWALLFCTARTVSAQDAEFNLIGTGFWSGANDIEIQGDYAYCSYVFGILVIDISDIQNPQVVSRLKLPEGATLSIKLQDTLLYAANTGGGLKVIDVRDPLNLTIVKSLYISEDQWVLDIALVDNRLYVVSDEWLHVYDNSDPLVPVLHGSLEHHYFQPGIFVQADHVYIPEDRGRLLIIDTTDPWNPAQVGELDFEFRHLALIEDYLFAVGGHYILEFDISDPANPVETWFEDTTPYEPNDIAFLERYGPHLLVSFSDGNVRVYELLSTGRIREVGEYQVEGSGQAIAVTGLNALYAYGKSAIDIINVSIPEIPAFRARVSDHGSPKGIYVDGDFAFYTSPDGFNIGDLSNPREPVFLGNYQSDYTYSYNLDMQGPVAFVAAGADGLKIFDTRNRSRPQLFGSTTEVGYAFDVIVDGYIAYVISGKNSFYIVDATDVTAPVVISELEIDIPYAYQYDAWMSDVNMQGDLIYVIERMTGLHIIDIGNVSAPIESGKYEAAYNCMAVNIDGQYAYIAHHFGLDAIDISHPANPIFVDSVYNQNSPMEMARIGDILVVSGVNGISFYDVTDPSNPYFIESKSIPGFLNYSVTVAGDLIYVASEYGMSIFEAKLPTAINSTEEPLPKRVSLAQNRPNPFNPSTTIDYAVSRRSQVRLTIFDILGREVAVLLDKTQPAGTYSIVWDGKDKDGSQVASGVYFYQLSTDEEVQSRKMMMLK